MRTVCSLKTYQQGNYGHCSRLEETLEKTNIAFPSEHSNPGLCVCAALACDDVLELGQRITREEMCFLSSFTIETWPMRAHTLLAVQLNSIRLSRREFKSYSQVFIYAWKQTGLF